MCVCVCVWCVWVCAWVCGVCVCEFSRVLSRDVPVYLHFPKVAFIMWFSLKHVCSAALKLMCVSFTTAPESVRIYVMSVWHPQITSSGPVFWPLPPTTNVQSWAGDTRLCFMRCDQFSSDRPLPHVCVQEAEDCNRRASAATSIGGCDHSTALLWFIYVEFTTYSQHKDTHLFQYYETM